MHIRQILPRLLMALVFVSGAGCRKSGSNLPPAPSATAPLASNTVVRVHWLGKKRLGIEASAYYFMRLWGLPESAKLQAQSLDKLSVAPWRLWRGEAEVANAPTALLRPLLDDLVQQESYVEFRQVANQAGELAFAIKLDEPHSGLWRTNLAVVVASLTGVQNMLLQDGGRGWSIQQTRSPNLIELKRVGNWTLLGVAQATNVLLGEIVARIQRDHAPFPAPSTNYWLEADLDLQRVAGALVHDWNLPEELPRLSIHVTGDGGNVLTHGDLIFARPLLGELEPWNIPTNLVRDPLISFTAVRGFQPWLASWKKWNDLQVGPPPNQVCFWAMDGVPIQTYFAAPLLQPGGGLRPLADVLLRDGNPWLAAHGVGNFVRASDADAAMWAGLPVLAPFVKAVGAGNDAFAFGGLLPAAGLETNRPPSPGMIHDVLRRTNLVYYDWEVTGPRIESWLYIGQVARLAFRHAQLTMDSASMNWLRVVSSRLDKCTTLVTRTGTNQLSFIRKSTAGLTAPELQLLVDWLESPQFPRGLYSQLVSPAGATPPSTAPAKP
ncbi:MAG: hypothetical protein HY298_00850 [Verrucomicrobia bacterium]|nr:hypothetical protein [Verrucomicrobiota bacterium]